MERIRLSGKAKDVMRLLYNGMDSPSTYPPDAFAAAVDELESKGLAKGAWTEGHRLEAARLTSRGKVYISINPSLRGPINWAKVSAIASCIATLLAVISFLLACNLLIKAQ